MKKIFIVFVFIFSVCSCVLATNNMNLEYDGKIHAYNGPDVTLFLNGEIFTPSEGQMPPIIIDDRTLVPVREVFEKLGGMVEWNDSERSVKITFEEKSIKLWLNNTTAIVDDEEKTLDVPAKLINEKTMVPARFISENAGLIVDWDDATKTVLISKDDERDEMVSIDSVECIKQNGIDVVVVTLDKKAKYNSFKLLSPDRVILDIENSKLNILNETLTFGEDKAFSQIRFGLHEDDVNRIVIDTRKSSDYSLKESEDGTKIYIAFSDNFEIVPSDNDVPIEITPDDSYTDDNTKDDENVISDETNIDDEMNNTDDEDLVEDDKKEVAEITSNITSIKYSTASEKVRIILDGKFEYQITTLEDPKRIVLDFNSSALDTDGPTTINLKNKPITTVEASENDNGTARVVLEISNNATYEISKKTSELQVKVEEPSYKNVEYTNVDEYAELILRNVSLSKLTKTQSKNTKKYTIKYSSSSFDSGTGAIEINDDFIKKINVTKTKITITDKGNIRYSAKQVDDDVVIKIEKVDPMSEKIILLDAGHGGDDPGSGNGGAKESTYNLKVLLELKDLLEDAGYTVYATREKDVTLSVNDRVWLATKEHPEAALYVSIHHNSVDNKNSSGTLVMYCDRDTSDYGITNKEFASFVLEELVDKLDTINRGFIKVEEDDTTKRVLTEVTMPSILCEVAFMSNDDELERIKTEKFQKAAAEAIFDGIEKALNEMD